MRDLKADLELCEAATEGPWEYKHDGYGDYCVSALLPDDDGSYCWNDIPFTEGDAKFISAARTGWPEAIRRAMQAEEALEKALKLLETSCASGLSRAKSMVAPKHRVCALPDCGRLHTRQGLYCSTKCTNVAAKRAQREREKLVFVEFIDAHKKSRTWEELLQLWAKEFPEGRQYKTVKGFRRAALTATKELGFGCNVLQSEQCEGDACERKPND